MSPPDLGEILKPFVFLDLFDHEGAPFNGDLHPHSGIATLTYVAEGTVSYIDPDNVKAHCRPAPSNGCRLDVRQKVIMSLGKL
jgi:redox-sensitive bicupin YhaK (pirin superfamily)